jgi:glycosyltransferase involved in cell wall biosynthesis
MDAETDTVSVVVPTHYRNERLAAAVESATAQRYDPVEVVVVDDSGERHAEPVAERYDVTYVAHDENRGANAARNTGIERSAGRYVQLLDDDDRLHPEKVRTQVALLQSSPDVGVAYCGVEHSTGERELPDPDARGEVLDRALAFDLSPCMNSTMLLERSVLDAVTPLTVRPSADDLGFLVELAQVTRFDCVDEALVTKAVAPDSRGQGSVNAEERLRIMAEYEHLYDRFPPALRQQTKSETYHRLGAHLLNERLWSARAVAAYWRSLRYDTDPGPLAYLGCVVALFGRPGVAAANRVRRSLARASGE